MSGSTMFMSVLFFAVLIWGVWWLAWQTSKAHHELLQEQKEAREAEEERKKERKRESKTKKYNPTRPKREVVFREVEEDEDEEVWEDEAPKGKHVYDSKAHKVVWVPAE